MINGLFRTRWIPLALRVGSLAMFIFLIIAGLAANTEDMAFAKVLRNTNIANLIVWSYWWPLVIIGAVFLGRVWCMVCPMELLVALSAKVGLRRKPWAILRSGWAITIVYVVILFVGIHTLSIHRVPFRMGLYLACLLGLAAIVGLIFENNTFCRFVCPVGYLLGLYARLAPVGWTVRDASVCDKCKDKSCIAGKNRYDIEGRSCGVGLVPQRLDDNADCLLCGQCLKACDRYGNGQEGRPNPAWLGRPVAKDLQGGKPLTGAQAAFLLVVSGFVIYEILSEWSQTKPILLWLPEFVQSGLSLTGVWGKGLSKSLLLFVVVPGVIWLLPYVLHRVLRGTVGLRSYLTTYSAAFIPIMAGAHVAKSVLKMTSRIGYWPSAVKDPIGIKSANLILDGALTVANRPGWMEHAVTWSSLLLIAGGIALSIRIIRKVNSSKCPGQTAGAAFYLIPCLYGAIFAVTMIAWRLL